MTTIALKGLMQKRPILEKYDFQATEFPGINLIFTPLF
jgi:hypothetical protein